MKTDPLKMIDRAAYDHYWDKGWLVVEGVFERAEADRIAELATEVGLKELSSAPPMTIDRSDDGQRLPRKIAQPFLKDEIFRKFALDERVLEIVKLLLGKQPLLMTDQIFMKPPRFGSAKPFHQDNAYFQCVPSDEVITSWVALDDVDESNGCLRYIDGSHRGGILPHEPLPGEPHNRVPPSELIDLSKESLALVRKGGVVFHHSQTLHTSHRNESDRWRRAYGGHWVTADVCCEKTDESMPGMAFDSLESAYFLGDLYPTRVNEVTSD